MRDGHDVTAAGERMAEGDRDIVATRVLDAPRELVWAAWTDPEQIARWWGPRGFTNTIEVMDVRPGGTWRFVMHGPDGRDYRNESVYVEVAKPERLVLDHVAPAFRMTATFAEEGGKTRVTVRMRFPTAALRDRVAREVGAVEGLAQNLEKLGEHLEGVRGGEAPRRGEAVITRLFDAPRPLVFEAWTRPEHLVRWFGPKGFSLPVCDVDFRPGGAYRFVMRGPDGVDYPFHGVYREISPPARLVFTAVLEVPGADDLLTTVTFDEEGGKTRITVRQGIPSSELHARGQHQGWSESLGRLAEMLRSA